MTKQQRYYEKHKAEINAKRKNTSVRDAKNKNYMINLAACLHYICTKTDVAGKFITASDLRSEYGTKYINLVQEGWSEPLVINESSLGKSYNVTQRAISNHLKLLEKEGYIEFIDLYMLPGSSFKSKVYICNLKKMDEDFANEFFDIYEQVGQKFFNNLMIDETDKEAKDLAAIKRNNRCMQYTYWHHVKCEVEEWNSYIPEKFKTKFLNRNEDGDYIDGRCYNLLCSKKNPEKHPDDIERINLLKELYGNTEYEELDVNSNILRINYYLINNKPFPIDKDVYYELLKNMGLDLTKKQFKESGARDIIKSEFMPIYMKPQSVYIKQKNTTNLANLNKVQKNTLFQDVKDIFGIDYIEFLGRLKEAIYRFLMIYDYDSEKTYRLLLGPMYFKFETAVATKMNLKFKKLGIDSINVYDGFYFKKGAVTKELFYKVFHEALAEVVYDMEKYNYNINEFKIEIKYFKYQIDKPKTKCYVTKTYTKKQMNDDYIKTSKDLSDEEIDFYNELRNNKALEKELVKQKKLTVW